MSVIALHSLGAYAGEFGYGGTASVSADYDDNVNLTVSEPISSASGVASVGGKVDWHQDNWVWNFAPRFQALRYRNAPLFDRDNAFLTTALSVATERSAYALQLDGTQDSTLTSEAGLTGVTQVNKRHRNGVASLSGQWNLSELTMIGWQGAQTISRYQDAASVNLLDYDYVSSSVNLKHAWSERLTLTAGGSYGKLRVHGQSALDKNNLSATAGLQYIVNDRSQVSVFVGPSRVRTQGSSQSGAVYSAQYQWQRELATFSTSLSRSVTPTGFGALSRQDSLDLTWYQPLNERWFSSVTLSGLRNRYVQQTQQAFCDPRFVQFGICVPVVGIIETPIDIKYGVLTGNLGWHLTPTLDLRLSAGVATQRVNVQEGRAERQHYALSVNWYGLTHTLH